MYKPSKVLLVTPEREKQIRDLVSTRYGVDSPVVFNTSKELLAEIDSLREALRIFGGHCSSCETQEGWGGAGVLTKCTCGFREVFKKAIRNIDGDRTENHLDSNPKPGGV